MADSSATFLALSRDPAAARWLRLWALGTVLTAAMVLALGALITTFGVGMSDQAWPTEPWYLAVNGHVWAAEPARGFLIEHTHRLAAWSLGVWAVVLPLGAWAADPARGRRRFGLAAIAVLLAGYGALHMEMRAAWTARAAGAGLAGPGWSLAAVGVGLLLTLAAVVSTARSSVPGRWLRVAATAALVAVMAQGLLGGFRVYLNQLFGTQLAAVHGAFAQVTFALLVATAALTGRPRALPAADRRGLLPLAGGLLAAVLVQLAWGVLVRHLASPVAQRLHILTAFVVVGLVVWAAVRILSGAATRRVFGGFAYHLLALVALQLVLGVEAYLGKFAVAGPQAALPVSDRAVTAAAAAVRTAHTVLGAVLLASAAVLAVRVGRAAAAVARRDAPPARAAQAVKGRVGV